MKIFPGWVFMKVHEISYGAAFDTCPLPIEACQYSHLTDPFWVVSSLLQLHRPKAPIRAFPRTACRWIWKPYWTTKNAIRDTRIPRCPASRWWNHVSRKFCYRMRERENWFGGSRWNRAGAFQDRSKWFTPLGHQYWWFLLYYRRVMLKKCKNLGPRRNTLFYINILLLNLN